MTSDASGSWGLGASFGDMILQRAWRPAERDLPIYVLEMHAFLEALRAWKHLLQH